MDALLLIPNDYKFIQFWESTISVLLYNKDYDYVQHC